MTDSPAASDDAPPADTRPGEGLIPPLTEDDLARQVRAFYARARGDDLLGPVFAAAIPADEWEAHMDKIAGFWANVMLGIPRYRGFPLRAHIMLGTITPDMFPRWLSLWETTAREELPAEAADRLILQARRIGSSFALGMFYHAASAAPRPDRA